MELRNYGADNVIDNKRKLLRDVLLATLPQSESASFALGYFFISGFNVIIEPIRHLKKLRLLISNTTNQSTAEALIEGFKTVRQAKKELKVAVEKKIPEEYQRYMVGLDEVSRNAWDIALSSDVDKTRLDALNFVLQCSKQRMDAIMNPPVLTKSNGPLKRFKGNSYLDTNNPKVSNKCLTVKKKEINKTQNPPMVGDFINTKNNG